MALDLPPDYFREYREALVVEEVLRNAPLREELYGRLAHEGHRSADRRDGPDLNADLRG
jgi:hypothetical protein